ncbi:MAG: S8 family serine peptidase [Hyphomonadaceae bacterium]
MTRLVALLFLITALAAPAQAQLPGVELPQIPNVGVQTPDVGNVVNDAAALTGVRELRVRQLLRRRELEADPAGQPIVRSQIIAVGMSEAAIATARAAGFQIVSIDDLGEAGAMVTLRAPAGQSTRRALRRLRETDPNGAYDFDHLHIESGAGAVVAGVAQSSASNAGPRIGLIDSGVGVSVPTAAQRSFVGAAPVAAPHGTTIAGLLSTAAPGARIYAADIYAGAPTGGASSALARALAWLAAQNTRVINVSLVGPRNRVVETVIAGLVSRGFIIVAAVGNDGPAAAPLYPASYPGVVGVTGVDARSRVLIEAGRGEQVDFAALGVHGRARGTSYAAPIVAARLAVLANDATAAPRSINDLAQRARDLGANGRDDVYGYGLVESR